MVVIFNGGILSCKNLHQLFLRVSEQQLILLFVSILNVLC